MVLSSGLAIVAVAMIAWRFNRASYETAAPFEPTSRAIEPSPLCPWREPDADMRRFFPEANRHTTETSILRGFRVELAKQLRRQPSAEENSLTLHRVFKDAQPLGTVLAQRVKGEHGAIELVLAVTERGEVQDVRLQRLREPAAVADALQDRAWLGKFQERTHDRGWDSDDLSGIPSEARVSAQAIREGIHSLLILLATSEGLPSASSAKPHH